MPRALIVTALPVEFLAVRARVSNESEVDHQGTLYRLGEFTTKNRTWEILVAMVGMGNTKAAVETERAITFFNPDVALFVGVAGGVKDVKIGDVVIGSKVYDYEYGKADKDFLARPESKDADYRLLQRAHHIAIDDTWQHRILETDSRFSQNAIVGPIGAGSKVVVSKEAEALRLIREHYNDTIAVEMEGHGFLQAVYAAQRTRAIVVRGISDLIEGKGTADKNGSQKAASDHAAAFAFELIARTEIGAPPPDSANGSVSAEATESKSNPEGFSNSPAVKRPKSGRVEIVSQAGTKIVQDGVPSRTRSFRGRKQELQFIQDAFSGNGSGVPVCVALHGLSGVGKTQIAREWYERARREGKTVYWIPGTDELQLEEGLARLAIDLGIPGANELNIRSAAVHARNWLETHDDWLIVIDDSRPDILMNYLPSSGNGHLLVTAQNPHWASITHHSLTIRGLDEEDAVAFLMDRTGQTDQQAAGRIAQSFEALPLALEQAAAYIEASVISFADYENLLKSSRARILDEKSHLSQYPRSVYAAFRLNIQALEGESPNSIALLYFLSFMHSNKVPIGLVRDAISVYSYQLNITYDDFVFNGYAAALTKYSLLTISSDSIQMHSLFQDFLRDSLDEPGRAAWGAFAESILANAFPTNTEDSNSWPECAQLIEHVLRVVRLAQAEGFYNPNVLVMLDSAIGYLSAIGRTNDAVELAEVALNFIQPVYGEDSPRAAVIYNNKANLLFDIGHKDDAIDLASKAVRILSKDRKSRKRYAVELGKCLSNLGRMKLWHISPAEGRKYLLQAYEIHKRLLGANHYTTAIDINNIGVSYREEKNIGEAYSYFREAVAIHRKILSPTDYRLAVALMNQGAMAGMLEHLDEAEKLLKEAIDIFEVVFGDGTDYDYFNAYSWYATTMYHKQRYRDAIEYYEKGIIKARELGNHEDMISQMTIQRRVCIFEACRYLFEYEN